MDKQTDVLMNLSVLYRSTQKYYDRMLFSMKLTYAQLPILIMIYEREGISMHDIAQSGVYDKGTISKTVKHLEQNGFITIMTSEKDKRNKELYTTDYAKQQMSKVYEIRRDWWQHLIQNIDPSTFDEFLASYEIMASNARAYAESQQENLVFFEWKKVSVSAYPDKMATVLSIAGCNFCCPSCIKSDLVYIPENRKAIADTEIRQYLEKRAGIIEAVCIEGAEPLMHPHLKEFLKYVKDLHYMVKINTNGSFPSFLQELIEEKLVDYVSLSLKSGPRSYAKTIGMENFDTSLISRTLEILKESAIDYDVTIHLIRQFHTTSVLKSMMNWISHVKHLILVPFNDYSSAIQKDLCSIQPKKLGSIIELCQPYCDQLEVRE